MSKRNKKMKQFLDTVEADPSAMDDHFSSPKGKKPRSRDRKKSAKRAYYDD